MKRSPKRAALTLGEGDFVLKRKKRVPYEFVLDALAAASPWTRPMFGCLAVYVPTRVGEPDKIAVILREKTGNDPDNGVWLATTVEHHESLRREFPNMRSIKVFGKKGSKGSRGTRGQDGRR